MKDVTWVEERGFRELAWIAVETMHMYAYSMG